MSKSVSVKNSKKIGLFVAISMLIGSIVGVGIFFKNTNIFLTNDMNAISIIVAWLFAAIICLFTAICFSETSSSISSHAGLGGWCYRLIGKRFGNFIKIIQPLFYFITIMFSISIFAGEAVFNIFDYADQAHMGWIFLVGLAFFLLFIIFNFLSIKHSGRFQAIVTSLKFVPLLMVVLGGIIYGVMNPSTNLLDDNNIISPTNKGINFTTILISLPSILFAFDSFVSIGNLSKDMRRPERNVPLAVVIAMVIVGVFYLLVTVGQVMVGSGNVYEVFDRIIPLNTRHAVKIIVSIFIFVSVIGVLNAFCASTIRSTQSLIEERLIIFSNTIERFANRIVPTNNSYKPGLVLTIIFYLFVFIIVMIPSLIVNSDVFVDGISNFPTTLFFAFYASVILATLINRFTKKVVVRKVKGLFIYAPIAIIGCYLVFFFQVFYTFTTATIIDPHGIVSWGLFSSNNFVVENWHATIVFGLYFIILGIYFIINKVYVDRIQHSNYPFLLEVNYE